MKKGDVIVELRIENFKKIRLLQIRPNGNLIQITGRNGQGKTSTIEAIYFAFKGPKALPLKPVRKGTERMLVKIETTEYIITRTLAAEGSNPPTLTVETKAGDKVRRPQDVLDQIFGALTFDPLAFVQMNVKQKVEELRRTANVDLDFEALEKEYDDDFKARSAANKELKELEAILKGMTGVYEGLPEKKLDEQKIMDQLNSAGEANQRAQEVFIAKQKLGQAAADLNVSRNKCEQNIETLKAQIKSLTEQLKVAEQTQKQLVRDCTAAEKAFRDAPSGDPIDVAALTAELASAQRTNRAIEQREIYDTMRAKRDKKKHEADAIDTRMKNREEKKRTALESAKIPVEGLTFDDRQVLYKGIPIESLGEGEQIRISAQIGMASNPKLRVMCIHHGEALDEEGLKILADLAEQHNFQIWMARVDSSGMVGIVLEDGMVAGSNVEEA